MTLASPSAFVSSRRTMRFILRTVSIGFRAPSGAFSAPLGLSYLARDRPQTRFPGTFRRRVLPSVSSARADQGRSLYVPLRHIVSDRQKCSAPPLHLRALIILSESPLSLVPPRLGQFFIAFLSFSLSLW